MSPAERRRIDRRTDSVLRKVFNVAILGDERTDPRTHCILACEVAPPELVDRRYLTATYALLGFRVEGLPEVLMGIDSEQARNAERAAKMPVIVHVDGWISVAFISARRVQLSAGGDA